jgi:hypothetical protein
MFVGAMYLVWIPLSILGFVPETERGVSVTGPSETSDPDVTPHNQEDASKEVGVEMSKIDICTAPFSGSDEAVKL